MKHSISSRILFGLAFVTCMVPAAVFAAGSAAKPTICSRSCWGAQAPRSTSYMSAISKAVIHHTAGNEFSTTGYEASKANVRAIQNYHRNSLGWADIGYHFLVDKFGYIFEGRYGSMSSKVLGSHTAGNNTNTFGFNGMGYFHAPKNNVPTAAMMASLAKVIAWRMPAGYTANSSTTPGHYALSSSACPGSIMINKLGELRTSINSYINGGGGSSNPDRIDVVARAADGTIQHKWFERGMGDTGWSGWESLGGGNAVGDPCISSQEPGRLNVFYRGTDNNLYHKYYSTANGWGPGGRTDPWQNLGGTITSSPDSVSWADGKIDVVARGADGTLVIKWYSAAGGWSTGFASLGGSPVGDPCISSQGSGRLNVFYRGADNGLYHKYYNSNGWAASWENLGGPITSGPDSVSWADGRIDVIAKGADGSAITHKWYTSTSGWSTGWENMGGASTSDPSICSWESRRLDLFYKAADNTLAHKWFADDTWEPEGAAGVWDNEGGSLASGPDAVSWN